MHVLIVSPVGRGRYSATLAGETIVTGEREPLFAAARAMLANGMDPDATIVMRHEGSAINCLSGKVGKLARLDVREYGNGPRITRYSETVAESPPVRQREVAATGVARRQRHASPRPVEAAAEP